jgi:hypothetical protein
MLRTLLISALFAGFAVSSAGADTAPASSRECFRGGEITGFNVIDDHSVRVTVSPSRRYVLSTTWDAHNLNWSENIALHSATGLICTGNGLGVEIVGGEPRQTYPVTGVARAPAPAPHT